MGVRRKGSEILLGTLPGYAPRDFCRIHYLLLQYPPPMEDLKSFFISKGFYVTDGLKYGVDYLLYTDLPSKVHSKYAVLLDRNQTLFDILSTQRVCLSVNKKLIFVRIIENEIKIYGLGRWKDF